jgi:hypothetical protein
VIRRAIPCCLLALPGCALQLGGHGATAVDEERVVYGAHAAAYTAPWTNDVAPHVGVEMASEVEHELGSDAEALGAVWTGGVQAGVSYWFPASRWSIQAQGNLGVPLSGGPYDGYAGATLAFPVETGPAHNVTDMNHAFQFVSRRISVVPVLRYRGFWADEPVHTVGGGLAVRARLSTDLL